MDNIMNAYKRTRKGFFDKIITFLVACFILVLPLGTYCQEPEGDNISNLLQVEHELSLAFETPHTKWAKPYALGKIRVLFFTAQFQGSTYTREIIELMQRFDLEADAGAEDCAPADLVDQQAQPFLGWKPERHLALEHDEEVFGGVAPPEDRVAGLEQDLLGRLADGAELVRPQQLKHVVSDQLLVCHRRTPSLSPYHCGRCRRTVR